MTYFLDFDRTIFDFDAFFIDLINVPALSSVKEQVLEVIKIPRGVDAAHDEKRNKMWEKLHALYSAGAFSFAPGTLTHFVFPDARAFLEKHGTDTVIVTKGGLDLSFQKGKVDASDVSRLARHCEYVMRTTPKGEVMKSLVEKYPGPHVFVDDFSQELDSVATENPGVALYEIRRDGKPGSGRFPVISSLAELP
ncbi:hypothetical protein K2X83_02775 [Patescibacteria group bacterium]|nr:hypothetical protein [Patescibacteria group bacterium]